ncbi:DUF4178 domain-containing protein, partial [Ideonella sp.]|uniref:DUF4178 domain-containing protein n=1 Tax=Ideonella sp. TaxID=1929293 RepID=UPI003BB4A70B
EGEALRRIGLSAELFDDHSPLQLGASGRYQGLAFSLVGRLQMRYGEGSWNEWHALFEPAAGAPPRSAWLSEDNGAYVLAFDMALPADAPANAAELAQWQPGHRLLLDRQTWSVASVQAATLAAAEGELPRPPRLGQSFTVADLRSERDEVGTLDDLGPVLNWSVGRGVTLAGLALRGLREGSEQTLGARGIDCPSCGATIQPTLASTRSISCPQCKAVVDLSPGAGADLAHYAQNNSGAGDLGPQIPLGSTGKLDLGAEGPLDWQVLGYQERCDLPGPGDDEQTFWREYLLYNRTAGFAFLVDAEDGWSWMRPLTGAPVAQGRTARWQGLVFNERYRYPAKVTWVQGEFYWQVTREQRAEVTDYDGPRGSKLSREQTTGPSGSEVVWSLGKALDAQTVARAFRLPAGAQAALRRDAGPLSGLGPTSALASAGGLSHGLVVLGLVVVLMLVMGLMMRSCSSDDCDEVRSTFGAASAEARQCEARARSGGVRPGGGSFGGFSSGGGGHK